MYVMVIDADIYNTITEFKVKNETITINRNYSNVDKKFWRVKYVNEHQAYDKNNAGYVNVGTFSQQSWCHCKWEKCVDE